MCNKKNRLVLLLFMVLGIALILQSCPAESPEISKETKLKLTALLAALDSAGNKVYPEPRFYGSNLWQYINGAAELYRAYDFVALALQRYRSGKSEMTVEIYDMGSLLNAFGIYAAERSPDLSFIQIGAQGYSEPQMLNFYQGPYYIKLSLDEPGEQKKSLKEIAAEISRQIGENHDSPPFYQIFPLENRLANTEQYLKKAPLGHPFLAPAYQVAYQKKDHRFQIVVSQSESNNDAAERMLKLKQHFHQSGTVKELPESTFLGENSDEGRMICRTRLNYIIILLNPPNDWQPWMASVAANLKK
jgi:hypothetical protein